MSSGFPKINPMGERAILIEFEPDISEKTLKTVLFFKNLIHERYLGVKVEIITTYSSLLIYYPITIENVYTEIPALKTLFFKIDISKKIKSMLYRIPVCYDPEFGLDLLLISEGKKLSRREIIRIHTQPIYTVYFIGFLPGFLYLGGLDERLKISRKKQPRSEVKKGAVGIAENQTGIYPKTSPGGWQIIGNSPVSLFDKNKNPPCQISAGDKVAFYSISKKEHFKIFREIEAGKFQFKKEVYEGRG